MAREGFGTKLVGHSSGFFAEVTGVDWDGIERAFHESTHMETPKISNGVAARTYFMSDLVDFGQLRFQMYYDGDRQPPVYDDPETITLEGPVPRGKSRGPLLTGPAGLNTFGASMPFDQKMTCDAGLKWLGAVTFTPSA